MIVSKPPGDIIFLHLMFIHILSKSIIDYTDEFFQLKEVKRQIHLKKLHKVETITGG